MRGYLPAIFPKKPNDPATCHPLFKVVAPNLSIRGFKLGFRLSLSLGNKFLAENFFVKIDVLSDDHIPWQEVEEVFAVSAEGYSRLCEDALDLICGLCLDFVILFHR